MRVDHCSAPSAEAAAATDKGRLLPQPHGFESLGLAAIDGEPDHSSASELEDPPTVLPHAGPTTCTFSTCGDVNEHSATKAAYLHDRQGPVGKGSQQSRRPLSQALVPTVRPFPPPRSASRIRPPDRGSRPTRRSHGQGRPHRPAEPSPRSPATSPTPTAPRLRGPLRDPGRLPAGRSSARGTCRRLWSPRSTQDRDLHRAI